MSHQTETVEEPIEEDAEAAEEPEKEAEDEAEVEEEEEEDKDKPKTKKVGAHKAVDEINVVMATKCRMKIFQHYLNFWSSSEIFSYGPHSSGQFKR